ncbi:MAG: hypothetical protein PHW34_02020 [Hespellia sp.]|nr:hypothetical protein [Hespellia sp.]
MHWWTLPCTPSKDSLDRRRRWCAIGVLLLIILVVFSENGNTTTVYAAEEPSGEGQMRDDSATVIAETLLQACMDQNQDMIRQCMQLEDSDSNQEDLKLTNLIIAYLQVMDTQELKINGSEEIFQEGNYTYTGTYCTAVLAEGKEFPMYYTFITTLQDGTWRIVPSTQYPEPIKTKVQTSSSTLEQESLYQEYLQQKDFYEENYPGELEQYTQQARDSADGVTGTISQNTEETIKNENSEDETEVHREDSTEIDTVKEESQEKKNMASEQTSWIGYLIVICYLIGLGAQWSFLYWLEGRQQQRKEH